MSAAARRSHGMRNRFGGAFDQECRIETPGPRVSNGAGGWSKGPPIVQNAIPCELDFPTSTPRQPGGEATDVTLLRVDVRLPVGTAVSVMSRIFVAGQVFEVQDHDTGRSFAGAVLCTCVRSGDAASPTP